MDASTIPNAILVAGAVALTLCHVFRNGIRYAYDRWIEHRDHVAELRYPPVLDPHDRANGHQDTPL